MSSSESNVEKLAGLLLHWIYWAAAFSAFIFLLWILDISPSRDATDSPLARSNMALRTDYGTGCQYLESHSGSLSPRIGVNGKHICGVAK